MIRKGRRITAGAAWAGGCGKGEEGRKAISRYLRPLQVVVVQIKGIFSFGKVYQIKMEQIKFFSITWGAGPRECAAGNSCAQQSRYR